MSSSRDRFFFSELLDVAREISAAADRGPRNQERGNNRKATGFTEPRNPKILKPSILDVSNVDQSLNYNHLTLNTYQNSCWDDAYFMKNNE